MQEPVWLQQSELVVLGGRPDPAGPWEPEKDFGCIQIAEGTHGVTCHGPWPRLICFLRKALSGGPDRTRGEEGGVVSVPKEMAQ